MFVRQVVVACMLAVTLAVDVCDFHELYRLFQEEKLNVKEYTTMYLACLDKPMRGYQPTCNFAPPVTQAVVKFAMSGTVTDGDIQYPYAINGVISLVQTNEEFTDIQGFIEGAEAFLSDSSTMSIHVHELGEIADGCQTTAGHFNPCAGKEHSNNPTIADRHVGDVGQFQIAKSGITKIDFSDTQVKLSGPLSVLGRSITLHAGKSSARVACGTIAAAQWEGKGRHPEVEMKWSL